MVEATVEHPAVADVETLGRARAGDASAMADLWTIYQPQLLRLLRSNRTISPEDVASQVWLDVGRTLDRFVGDGDAFRRWVFTIARRRSIDEARRRQRRGEVSSDFVGGVDRGAVDDRFDTRDSFERALATVGVLSPAAAEAVMLRVVYDLPVADVAEMTGRSEGSVRILVHRGLARLRESLTRSH